MVVLVGPSVSIKYWLEFSDPEEETIAMSMFLQPLNSEESCSVRNSYNDQCEKCSDEKWNVFSFEVVYISIVQPHSPVVGIGVNNSGGKKHSDYQSK